MAGNGRKTGEGSAVIDRALKVGLQLASRPGDEPVVHLLLTPEQQNMLGELCDVLGLSTRSVCNGALRYALHHAQARGLAVTELKEYPRKLDGAAFDFILNADTLPRVERAGAMEQVAACVVAGLKLWYGKMLGSKPRR